MNGFISSMVTQNPSLLANQGVFEAFLGDGKSKPDDLGFGGLLDSITGGISNNSAASNNISSMLGGGIFIGNIGALLGLNEVPAADGLYPSTLSNKDGLESIIGSSGPLPSFLREVTASLHLNAAQTQSLYDITAKHMNIVKSNDSIAELAGELTAAGI